MTESAVNSGCEYQDASPTWANAYLWPELKKIIAEHSVSRRRAFDLGCGNGATANMLYELGFDVTGIDLSESGIALGRRSFPHLKLDVGNVYDDLVGTYGQFPLVVSLEVIEHCFNPRLFAKTFYNLIAAGGVGVLSTPYHGYWKNLALAVAGNWDKHLTALWQGGHVKFFSVKTLGALLAEVGFKDIRFVRVGRIPPIAKSMIAIVRK
jgi:2-polyprenyl-6-hydroxyphenyl methylase/3-demethylubiquinone-9 3-methyltransferase